MDRLVGNELMQFGEAEKTSNVKVVSLSAHKSQKARLVPKRRHFWQLLPLRFQGSPDLRPSIQLNTNSKLIQTDVLGELANQSLASFVVLDVIPHGKICRHA